MWTTMKKEDGTWKWTDMQAKIQHPIHTLQVMQNFSSISKVFPVDRSKNYTLKLQLLQI